LRAAAPVPVNEIIKRQRMALRAEVGDLAQVIGITVESYLDIEAYPDEVLTVTTVVEFRRLCAALSLDFATLCAELYADYLAAENFDSAQKTPSEGDGNPVVARRSALTISPEQLADLVGYDVSLIERVETDLAAIDSCGFEFCFELAAHLQLPWQQLLRIGHGRPSG